VRRNKKLGYHPQTARRIRAIYNRMADPIKTKPTLVLPC